MSAYLLRHVSSKSLGPALRQSLRPSAVTSAGGWTGAGRRHELLDLKGDQPSARSSPAAPPSFAEHVLAMSDSLGEDAQQQLRVYLAFLRRKREQLLSEVAAEFTELKESRLLEETYTLDEVSGLLDGLQDAVRASVRSELLHISHSAALLLVQVLEQAGGPGAPPIELDVPRTEDGELLRAIAAFENDAAAGGRANLAVRANVGKPVSRALPTIGGSVRDLEGSAATSLEKALKAEGQLAAVLRDKSALGAQLEAERQRREDAEGELAELRAAAGGSPAAASAAAAASSSRFKNLRTILAKKNTLVKSLREQLEAAGISTGDVDAVDES